MSVKILPEIVSVNQMYSLLKISRSRYYQLLNKGVFLSPRYSETGRPYFTREMARQNIEVVRNNMGVNGKICVFYRPSGKYRDKRR